MHLTGNQARTARPGAGAAHRGRHDAHVYLLPRSNRENGEFWLDGQGELWVGRRNSLPRARPCSGCRRDSRKLVEELAEAAEERPAFTRLLRSLRRPARSRAGRAHPPSTVTRLRVFLASCG
ncbi:hypothetical protein GXW82_32440 [Streptacidiphilus sp. 4-A2]|nr:hypothetical protein [Streptacidiphilus sp. 4-A2]